MLKHAQLIVMLILIVRQLRLHLIIDAGLIKKIRVNMLAMIIKTVQHAILKVYANQDYLNLSPAQMVTQGVPMEYVRPGHGLPFTKVLLVLFQELHSSRDSMITQSQIPLDQ
jgi:hypothetical protein